MVRVKRNEFIVNLQGISFDRKYVYLLLEFCANKSVVEYLDQNFDEYNQKAEKDADFRFLIKCCKQVASGMNKIKHVSENLFFFLLFFLSDLLNFFRFLV